MNNGSRNYSAMTAYQDPSSKLFSLYEPSHVKGVTLKAVTDKDGKAMRVDGKFVRDHKIAERTEP